MSSNKGCPYILDDGDDEVGLSKSHGLALCAAALGKFLNAIYLPLLGIINISNNLVKHIAVTENY